MVIDKPLVKQGVSRLDAVRFVERLTQADAIGIDEDLADLRSYIRNSRSRWCDTAAQTVTRMARLLEVLWLDAKDRQGLF